jgi:hypothetical protein
VSGSNPRFSRLLVPPEEIFVRLLNEGTDVWRPTTGRRVDNMVFEVLPTPEYEYQDEDWEFVPGTIVECEEQQRGEDRIVVAVRQVASQRGE